MTYIFIREDTSPQLVLAGRKAPLPWHAGSVHVMQQAARFVRLNARGVSFESGLRGPAGTSPERAASSTAATRVEPQNTTTHTKQKNSISTTRNSGYRMRYCSHVRSCALRSARTRNPETSYVNTTSGATTASRARGLASANMAPDAVYVASAAAPSCAAPMGAKRTTAGSAKAYKYVNTCAAATRVSNAMASADAHTASSETFAARAAAAKYARTTACARDVSTVAVAQYVITTRCARGAANAALFRV